MDKDISNLYEELIKAYILRLGEREELEEAKEFLSLLKEGANFGIKLTVYLEKILRENFNQQANALVKKYNDKLKESLNSLLANVGGGSKPVSIKSFELQAKLMLLPFEEFLNVLKAEVFKKGGIESITKEDSLSKVIDLSEQIGDKFYQDFRQKELVWPSYELSKLVFQNICGFLKCNDKQLWQQRFLETQKKKDEIEFSVLIKLLNKGHLNVLKNIYDALTPSIEGVKKGQIPFEQLYEELKSIDKILEDLGDLPNKDIFALNFFGKIVQDLKGEKNEKKGLLDSFMKAFGQSQDKAGLSDEQLQKLVYFVKKYHHDQSDSEG